MPKYNISNLHTSADLGTYDARDADDALDVMSREAGYSDFRNYVWNVVPDIIGDAELDAAVDTKRARLIITQIAD